LRIKEQETRPTIHEHDNDDDDDDDDEDDDMTMNSLYRNDIESAKEQQIK